MKKEITVTIQKKQYKIDKETISELLKDKDPGRIHTYFISVNEKTFPIKQAISVALGIPPMAFTSQTAYSILDNLGFDVQIKNE